MMLLGFNSFKTIVAQGNFPPKITHRQTEGNVQCAAFEAERSSKDFSEKSLAQCTKGKYTFVVQQNAWIACFKLKKRSKFPQ